jgi:hypothetical protein
VIVARHAIVEVAAAVVASGDDPVADGPPLAGDLDLLTQLALLTQL